MAVIAPSRIAQRITEGPVCPTREELAPLGRFERLAFAWCNWVNTHRSLKRASQYFLDLVGKSWVRVCTRHLIRLEGTRFLDEIDWRGPVLLCSNHRSFFDLYVISCWVGWHIGGFPNLYFPVRSNFFYENPIGLFVNMVMAAFAMYPPFFRQNEKKAFNAYALARTIELARQPRTLIGFHPEGTRGKGPDPYELLPAQPGLGQIIYEARPVVLPVFINGLGNDLPRQVWGNFNRKGPPIHIVFGRAIDLSTHYERSNRLRTHKEIADLVLAEIRTLGEREREMRASL